MKLESLDWSSARDILRIYREANVRKSAKVVDIWEAVLSKNVNRLGDERYVIFEQVYISALDCHRMDIANDCLNSLIAKFPNSRRVHLLQELMLEAIGKFDEALELLNRVIEEDETNAVPRKRKITILKTTGKITDAIKELNEYLKTFMVDQEAWNELSNLYLVEQEFGKAAFCIEELILQQPHNHLYHQRFAEIKYTQGGYENLELAMSYFSHALRLCSSNMRALFGLFLSAKQISTAPKCSGPKKAKINAIVQWTLKQIELRYANAATQTFDPEDLEDKFGSLCLSDSD